MEPADSERLKNPNGGAVWSCHRWIACVPQARSTTLSCARSERAGATDASYKTFAKRSF